MFPSRYIYMDPSFSFSEVLQHNLGKFSDNSLLQNAFKKNSLLSDFNILCLLIYISSMTSIFSWVYTHFSPNVVLDFSSRSSVIFCFLHRILSLCTSHHSPPRNIGFFCLWRFPIVSLRSGEIKDI